MGGAVVDLPGTLRNLESAHRSSESGTGQRDAGAVDGSAEPSPEWPCHVSSGPKGEQNMSKGKTVTVGRSAKTGHFVKVSYAKSHPNTTVVERVRKK